MLLLASFPASSGAAMAADSRKVAETERIYADLNDTVSIIATIDSGLFTRYQGKDRAGWVRASSEKRKALAEGLSRLPAEGQGLSASDAKAVDVMRAGSSSEVP